MIDESLDRVRQCFGHSCIGQPLCRSQNMTTASIEIGEASLTEYPQEDLAGSFGSFMHRAAHLSEQAMIESATQSAIGSHHKIAGVFVGPIDQQRMPEFAVCRDHVPGQTTDRGGVGAPCKHLVGTALAFGYGHKLHRSHHALQPLQVLDLLLDCAASTHSRGSDRRPAPAAVVIDDGRSSWTGRGCIDSNQEIIGLRMTLGYERNQRRGLPPTQ